MAVKLRYRVNTSNIGWTPWSQSGNPAGNTNDPTDQVLAMEINLDDKPANTQITYAVNIKEPNFWSPLVSNGITAGFPGSGLFVDKIYADLINAGGLILLYSVHISPFGWIPWVISSNANSSNGVGIDNQSIQAINMILVKNS